MPLSSNHIETLKNTSRFLAANEDPWWVLGSAAIALCGVDPQIIRDIDVVISPEDARRLMTLHDLINQADGGDHRFRSGTMLRPDLGPVRVEILSNYEIRERGIWTPLALNTRKTVEVEGATLFVPELDEQIEVLSRLGREKDLQRIALIRSSRSN